MSATVDPAQTFLQEAQELLEQLEQTLLDLEHAPGNPDLVDTAFRALHTIKGSGAMFGFDAVAAFTHHVETAFDLVRKGEVAASAELVAVALAAKDQMRQLIEDPAAANIADGDAILRDLEAIVRGTPAAASPAPRPSAGAWKIAFRLPADAMANGVNPLLLLDELRALGDTTIVADTAAVPSLETLDPRECHIGWQVSVVGDVSRSAIEDVFLFVLDEMQITIEQCETPAGASAEPAPPIAAVEPAPAAMPAALADKPAAPAAPAKDARAGQVGNSLRVPAERLDELMDRVGELVIAQSRLKQVAAASSDPNVKSIAEEVERLALELRDTTMGIRMVPIGSLFGRFRRLVHDLARDLGKDIELITAGEDTELDKTVIERLNDPLIHLIRNALDHGLEAPAERTAAGKAATGHLSLSATHSGAEVLISLSDDGRGLNRARIQARAEEQGLIAPGTVLPDNELFQILFQPGFSTAREVTSLSGRGVGMDVVKRTIEGLRGTIDMTSRPGNGTTVTLRLPLTLAIIDGLLVRVGNGRYVIPLSAVEECVELSTAEDTRSKGRSFLNIRGDLVPYMRLREMFRATTPADRYQKVVVVSSGEQRVGLVVDQVIGDHQTVIKSLSKLHADVGTFSGATILGDGTVALILEVANLVECGQMRDRRLKAAS